MESRRKTLTILPNVELTAGYACGSCDGDMAFTVEVSWDAAAQDDVRVEVHARCTACRELSVRMTLVDGVESTETYMDEYRDHASLLDTILRARDLCDADSPASDMLRRLLDEGPFVAPAQGIDLWYRRHARKGGSHA